MKHRKHEVPLHDGLEDDEGSNISEKKPANHQEIYTPESEKYTFLFYWMSPSLKRWDVCNWEQGIKNKKQ